ncbi:nitroreductase [Geobacillus thermocatenulatus]|uniref:Putative NAD(P)H nitroreductase n=3 Tax=Geobacillus TaxID=129337 RepID=A0A226Q427_9BACL|nr:nitroreductase [Geobacillus thermocatenulatus]AST00222.1 nitroreductase [Geobacillus thermocatenulatus]KPC97281.1 putative NAD(P)H nitroreductase YdjA [Geobacillus sp. BCO2]OXB86664.1 nitroreductase [Geobacillus thermocatenulatus]
MNPSFPETVQYAGIAKTIRERRSIKKGYKPDPVPVELITELLNEAVWAPNHGLREPWRFLFVPTEQKEHFIETVASAFSGEEQEKTRRRLEQAKAFLIVIMREDPRQKQWEENFAAVSALIQNFQLLAWERQLGVVWKTNPHIYDPKVRERLGVRPGEKIVGFLHLGFFDPDQIPPARPRTRAEEKMTIYGDNSPKAE